MDVQDLELTGIIAFDGITKNGLQLHPDQEHMIYPMGNKVTIKNINSSSQRFFTGHTNIISALCVSPCGKYIASGQVNHLGFKAVVIIWDYEQRNIRGTHEIHKVRVEDVCFTCSSTYLISLGGRDDGNIVVWDVLKNEAICGSFASNETAGNACTITRMNLRDQCFISGGDRTLKVWRINPEMRKACGVNVKVGKLRRFVNCIVVDARDENAYCGTSTGDIIKVRLNFHHNAEFMEPVKTPVMVGCYSKMCKNLRNRNSFEGALYAGGVWCLILLSDHRLVIGAGDGTVELVKISETESFPNSIENKLKLPTTPRIITLLKTIAHSAVTSLQVLGKTTIIVGTIFCEIYEINISNFDTRLIVTCHTNAIYDIAFPRNYSEVFATGSKNDIKVWRLETQSELLRITIPNFVCSSLCFSYDGKMIISAWNDGLIRTFTPQTGKLIFTIHNSHIKAVSAIAVTSNGRQIISGGCDGQVRVWEIKPKIQKLACVLKEHKGPVTSLDISYNNEEVISASSDGTCIIWDLIRYARKQVLMANTIYMAARFSPNGIQILTCGTNRKISYWETLDGSLVREVEGSSVGAVNCLDLSPDGKHFVTGSSDCIIKVWNYHTGEASQIGIGHAAIITACKFSPDSKYIVTVSADGAIMIWNWLAKSSEPIDGVKKYPGSIRSQSACSSRNMELKKLSLDDSNEADENVMALTTRSHKAESVRSVHAVSAEANSMSHDCDLPKLARGVCEGADRVAKSPTSEHGASPTAKSIRSVHSAKSCSRTSSQLGPAAKNFQTNNQDGIEQTSNSVCKTDKQQSARAKTASNSTRSKLSPTMHCIQPLNTPPTRMNSNLKNYQATTVPVTYGSGKR